MSDGGPRRPEPVRWQPSLASRVAVCLAYLGLIGLIAWLWPPGSHESTILQVWNVAGVIGASGYFLGVTLFDPAFVAADEDGLRFGRRLRSTHLPWHQVRRIDDEWRWPNGRCLRVHPVYGKPWVLGGTSRLLLGFRRDRAAALVRDLQAWIPADPAAAVAESVDRTRRGGA